MSDDTYTVILADGQEFSGDRDLLEEWVRQSRVPPGSRIRLDTGEVVDSDSLDWIVEARKRIAPPQQIEDVENLVEKPDVMAHIIPARNVPALLSWYAGIFSLIPCLGGPLGLTAVVLGIIGLRLSSKPEIAVGFWHALIGLILGSIFGLLWLAVAIYMTIGAVQARSAIAGSILGGG